ncbi:uncharacterized protein LOC127367434 isoform X2 [Dicentrarchus labrax]|uniref:uncharacterized protein LOC127367434 isoform X2 n=1 Tax=Dicentrarchus labrax TaxID=13489 RepID=UPI0021F5AB2D|nr:uncharacterized protein LOC127367434 isoform X2 [Dicentrarchus labrax]
MCRSFFKVLKLFHVSNSHFNCSVAPGSLVNGINRCQSLLSASPSWSWHSRTHPQQCCPASIHHDKDDPATKRPRLQAQRKFAQSPPSSPGPPVLMTSARSNHTHNLAVVSCLTRRRPKTEDFLSFLCLRGSAALPSNMAFLASGQAKEPGGTQHVTSCLSTNHRTATEEKNMSIFSRVARVQQDSRSLRGSGGSAAVNSFCPLTSRAQRRKERERREEELQRMRKEGMEEDRREEAEGHLLRPSELSLQFRRTNKVAMVTGFSEQRTSYVRSIPPVKPCTGVGSRQSPRPSSTCKLGHPQSRPREINNKHLSRHSNQELPRSQHLPPHHRPVPNYCSNPKTFISLQNSGRNLIRSPAQIPLNNGSVIRQLSENPGVLRLSRRRRGLPPDTSPLNRVPLDNNSLNKCRTLQYNDGDVLLESDCHIAEIPQTEADSEKDVRAVYVNHMDKITGSHDEVFKQDKCGHIGEMTLERGSCISEDLQDKVNVGKLSLESNTNVITNYDLSPVSKVICRHVREKRLQRKQSASSTIPKPNIRTNVSRTFARAATARTTVTEADISSVTSAHVHTDQPANYSAKHTAKGTYKGNSKNITKCTSPACSYSIHNSKGAAKDSSKGTTEDLSATVSNNCSTSKGSTKALTQTKSPTSAIKTRTSPRILQKR